MARTPDQGNFGIPRSDLKYPEDDLAKKEAASYGAASLVQPKGQVILDQDTVLNIDRSLWERAADYVTPARGAFAALAIVGGIFIADKFGAFGSDEPNTNSAYAAGTAANNDGLTIEPLKPKEAEKDKPTKYYDGEITFSTLQDLNYRKTPRIPEGGIRNYILDNRMIRSVNGVSLYNEDKKQATDFTLDNVRVVINEKKEPFAELDAIVRDGNNADGSIRDVPMTLHVVLDQRTERFARRSESGGIVDIFVTESGKEVPPKNGGKFGEVKKVSFPNY